MTMPELAQLYTVRIVSQETANTPEKRISVTHWVKLLFENYLVVHEISTRSLMEVEIKM